VKDSAIREQLTTSVQQSREELFRIKREHARLLDQAASSGLNTPEGSAALHRAGEVGTEMVRALESYEQALTRLSDFARQWRPRGRVTRGASPRVP
jgi:uncharacterized membrane protein